MTDVDLPNLDDGITALPADIRRDIAERAKGSLYFMAKAVLRYNDMTPSCHGSMCEFLDRNPSRFKLVLMPRDHFKSSVCTIARAMQKLCTDWDSRILIANETTTNTQRFLSAIRAHAEQNRVFRALFSELIPKDTRKVRWNDSELDFNRNWIGPEPSIDTMGMTGAVTSRHFTHIIYDDIVSIEAVKSEKVMADTIDRASKFHPLFVRPESDTLDIVGTRWAFYDPYAHFMGKLGPKLAKYIRGAIEDGQPIFPERISLETLADIRNVDGEYSFSCLYMNNPRNSEVQDFNVQDLCWWRWNLRGDAVVLYKWNSQEIDEIVPLDELDIVTTVDLAAAEKIVNDRNALITSGATKSGKIIVLDVWARRCSPLAVIERLVFLHNRFHPRVYGIEGVAYQKAFKYFLKDECERQMIYMNIVELPASGKKERRIRGLQPVAATHRLFLDPTQHLLRQEMSDFPLGQFDDTVDALSYALQLWPGMFSVERQKKIREAQKRVLKGIRQYDYVTAPDDDDDEDFDLAPRQTIQEVAFQ